MSAGPGLEGTERTEVLSSGPAEALAALLDVAAPDAGVLPPMWHCVVLLDRPASADLGPDGHPVRHTVPVPPAPGLRRMFAGGRVRASGPLLLGQPATRRSRVIATAQKDGRSGRLTFLTVQHEYTQAGRRVLVDEQDLVYRLPPQAGTPRPDPAPPVPPGPDEQAWPVTPPLLFRFSALTYNAHRIHYDRDFAVAQEGYPGLLVHGPLQAVLMAHRAGPAWTAGGYRFRYRLHEPLFDGQGLIVGARPDAGAVRTHVRDAAGRTTASGMFIPGAGDAP